MAVLDDETVNRIKQSIKWHPRGITISDLSSKLKMNRNLVAKYLDMLLISGQVEMEVIGAAKVYFLARRIPVSALLEFSSDLVIMVDRDNKILQVNEPVLALLGEKKERLIGHGIDEIESPFIQILEKSRLAIKDPVPGQNAIESSCIVRDEERHFHIKQIPTAFEDGSTGSTFIIEEITARKNYQRRLEISEAQYRGLVRSSGEAIAGVTVDGRISSWNPAAQRLFGFSEPEVLDKPLHILVTEGGHEELGTMVGRVHRGECIQRQEIQMHTKSGSAIDTRCTICPIRGESGVITGASAIIQDITRDKLEQHAREQEDRYRNLVEDLNVGIYRSTGDPNGRFVWGNTALLRILGYKSLSELEEVRVTELFTKPDGRTQLLEELRKNGFVKNRILQLKKPDGIPILVSVTALAEFDERKDLIYINGIVQDITGYGEAGKHISKESGGKTT
ncbi:MAG TPA: PAS domain S-box protein [Methanoregulaceae archaeon]|nr:PAS domain S-box protein [Methanoregulaceae archaeon]HPD75324.1 PAS domain S-box protein [Methanoregulaceae archaeon]